MFFFPVDFLKKSPVKRHHSTGDMLAPSDPSYEQEPALVRQRRPKSEGSFYVERFRPKRASSFGVNFFAILFKVTAHQRVCLSPCKWELGHTLCLLVNIASLDSHTSGLDLNVRHSAKTEKKLNYGQFSKSVCQNYGQNETIFLFLQC